MSMMIGISIVCGIEFGVGLGLVFFFFSIATLLSIFSQLFVLND